MNSPRILRLMLITVAISGLFGLKSMDEGSGVSTDLLDSAGELAVAIRDLVDCCNVTTEPDEPKTPEQLQEMLYRAIMNDSYIDVHKAIRKGAIFVRQDTDLIGTFYDVVPTYHLASQFTPIDLAVYLTKSKGVRALLECSAKLGPDLQIKYANGSFNHPNFSTEAANASPKNVRYIDYAKEMGDLKTILALVEYGADFHVPSHKNLIFNVNVKSIFDGVLDFIDGDPETGLKALQALVDAKLPQRDHEGNTQMVPNSYDINSEYVKLNGLACAITPRRHGRFIKCTTEVLSLLLKNGADVNKTMYYPKTARPPVTPLQLAIQHKNKAAIEFLREAGAR